MMWFFVFGNALIVGLSGALMPGPLLTTVIAQSARRGFLGGFSATVGHALLELILVILLVLGLGGILTDPVVIRIIFVIGGVVLFGMGSVTIRQGVWAWRERSLPTAGEERLVTAAAAPVIAGVLTTASNPYWLLWWATVGMSYLAAGLQLGVLGVIMFYLGHIAADGLWYGAVAIGVSRGRSLIGYRMYSGLLMGCGSVLLCVGIYFALSGV